MEIQTEKDIWTEANQSLKSQECRTHTLTNQSQERVRPIFHPLPPLELHKLNRFLNLNIESILCHFQDLPRFHIYVPRVHEAVHVVISIVDRLDGCPEYPFATSSGIAIWMKESDCDPVFHRFDPGFLWD